MRGRSHGIDGQCSGLAKGCEFTIFLVEMTADSLQIGFSVLASVPGTGKVYPLLGRPHDSLLPRHKDDP